MYKLPHHHHNLSNIRRTVQTYVITWYIFLSQRFFFSSQRAAITIQACFARQKNVIPNFSFHSFAIKPAYLIDHFENAFKTLRILKPYHASDDYDDENGRELKGKSGISQESN